MMACFDQKSCMNYHSPQDTNTQTTTVARQYDRDIVEIWKLRVQSNLFNKDKWYGGWSSKMDPNLCVITQHISSDV